MQAMCESVWPPQRRDINLLQRQNINLLDTAPGTMMRRAVEPGRQC